jgi:Icc-related predicted phosphoesterase
MRWQLFFKYPDLKFLAISDTHGRHHSIRLPKADVLLHAGDISYHGKKEEVIDFLQWFARQKFEYKIFIAGNHDFYLEHAKQEDLLKLIPEGVTYLKDSGINIGEIKVWGSPVTPWFYNWAFNRHRGEAIRKHWDQIPPGTDLLMTHGPVYGFLDMVINEQHVGCQDLLRTVLTIQPKVHLCGHIHESYGSIKRSGIRFINASVVNEQYELANKPVMFEL